MWNRPRKQILIRFAGLTCLAIALAQPALSAPPLVSADADGNLGSNVAPFTSPSGQVRQMQSGSAASGSVLGSALATHGFLKAHGEATTVQGTGGELFAGGTGFYQDNFQIDSEGRAGQTGYITLGIVVAGMMTAQAQTPESAVTGISYAQSSLQIFGHDLTNALFSRTQQVFSNGSSTSPALVNEEHRVTFPFVFGTPFDVKVVLNATGRAYPSTGGAYNSDVSASWLGIIAVRDTPDGPQIPFFTLQSASPTNFLVPIPPPAINAVTKTPSGGKLLNCRGVPFRQHRVEASENPSGVFELIGTATAAADGQMIFTDNSTSPPRRLYRLVYEGTQ